MIQDFNEVEDSYLTPEELKYPAEEQQILRALRYLKDRGGFSRMDKDFGKDLSVKGKPFTAKQLLAGYKICKKYQRTQLAAAGILLPEEDAVQALAKRKEIRYAAHQQGQENPADLRQRAQMRIIGIKDNNLGIMFPDRSRDFESNLKKIRQLEREVKGLRLLRPDYCEVKFMEAPGKATGEPVKYWQVPLDMIEQVCRLFPDLQRTPDVQCILDEKLRKAREAHERAQSAFRAHQERTERLLGVLGSLDTVGDRTLYQHQKDAIYSLIDWESGILAHDPGLGKSLVASMIAKAYMKSEDCRVIVVGPKTLRANWVREAGWCEVPIEYFTHDSIPADIPGKYILIVDECHSFQNRQAKRSKKFLALAWKAEAVIAATGTPSKNGRPSNIYPLLLACKHPLVYAEMSDGTPAEDQIKKLRLNFEKRYCAATSTEYSEWDVTGAAFLEELHRKIVDSPRGVLRKRKDQCLDLPAKIRKLVPVDLTQEEAATYRQDVNAMWEEYQARVSEKLDAFVEDTLPGKVEKELKWWVERRLVENGVIFEKKANLFDLLSTEEIEQVRHELSAELVIQETQRIESGQALVMLGHLRHAGSRAKARAAIDQIKEIFEEDALEAKEAARENRPHKPAAVVVFCAYKDTAKRIADAFEVPVMSGDTPDKQRQPIVDDFQAGKTRVFVGVYGAGGVGITLTAAAHIILVDRAWTPGDIEQAEGRIERIGQDRTMISMWLQVPQFINPVDVKIDSILQQKQENIVKMLDGGLENYNEDQLFSAMANDLLWDATHFIAGKEESEVGQ